MTAREKALLLGLAEEMDEAGFESDADGVREYVSDDGAGWRSVGEFLAALQRDVWWHFGHVGDEEERPIYEAAERRIERVRDQLARANPAKCTKPSRLVIKRERAGAKLPALNITQSADAAGAALELIGDRAYEVFLVMYLNVRNCVIGYEELTQADMSGVAVTPSSLVRNALLAGARAVITAHQHPSGELSPSPDDEELWSKIERQMKAMDIVLLDNLIVTTAGYLSAAERTPTTWEQAGIDPDIRRSRKAKR
ncbi:MAG: JAB domain-containing protein [Deltaproteobacteria bacterium]|nr:JAB domain-containing protein [Deltaproteobacteria bacterium]